MYFCLFGWFESCRKVHRSLLKFLFWATANSFSNDSSADSESYTFSNAVSNHISNAVSNLISNLISNKLSNSEPHDESHRGLGLHFKTTMRVMQATFAPLTFIYTLVFRNGSQYCLHKYYPRVFGLDGEGGRQFRCIELVYIYYSITYIDP